jgi:hypothetical protein
MHDKIHVINIFYDTIKNVLMNILYTLKLMSQDIGMLV